MTGRYVTTQTSIYTDPDLRTWKPLSIYFYRYLYENEHAHGMSGIARIAEDVIRSETRMTKKQIARAWSDIGDKVRRFDDGTYWVIARAKHTCFTGTGILHPKMVAGTVNFVRGQRLEVRDAFFAQYPSMAGVQTMADMPVCDIRHAVAIRDNFTCAYCGKLIQTRSGVEVDHVIPRVTSGKTTYDNLVCACHECNAKKGGRTPDEAGMETPQPRSYHINAARHVYANDENVRRQFHIIFGSSPRLSQGSITPDKVVVGSFVTEAVSKAVAVAVSKANLKPVPVPKPKGGAPAVISQALQETAFRVYGSLPAANLIKVLSHHEEAHVMEAMLETEAAQVRAWGYTAKILQRWALEGYPRPRAPTEAQSEAEARRKRVQKIREAGGKQ